VKIKRFIFPALGFATLFALVVPSIALAAPGRGGYKTRGSGWSYDPDLINAIPSEIEAEKP